MGPTFLVIAESKNVIECKYPKKTYGDILLKMDLCAKDSTSVLAFELVHKLNT